MAEAYTSTRGGPEWKLQDMLVGRDDEAARLESLMQRQIHQQQEREDNKAETLTVLLHGAAGSGKSSLIRSLQPSLQQKGWISASGKYEQHRQAEPFSALIEAMNEIVDAWVIENGKRKVCQMGGFRNLLVEDLEFLKHILPKAYSAAMSNRCSMNPDVMKMEERLARRNNSFTKQDLGTVERLNVSIVRVLKFLCAEQQVMLFLDDVHWADSASLDVIQTVACCGEVQNLFLVCSYRDEEVEPESHLQKMLTYIKEADEAEVLIQRESQEARKQQHAQGKEGDITEATVEAEDSSSETLSSSTSSSITNSVYDISVGDLSSDSVNNLVASVLNRYEIEETKPLSEVIFRKTAGNPFFVTQFLLMLRQEDFLQYSYVTCQWEWGDIEKLSSAAHISDNVADLVARTLSNLPEATRVALKVAACLGKIIPLHVLTEWFDSFYDDKQAGNTCCASLQQVQLIGLQNVLNDAVKVGVLVRPVDQDAYMWAHDKLQSVAYDLIPEEFRPELHIGLGKLLWKLSKSHPDEEWMVYMAADQMNRFSDYKQDEVLGADVATLCLEAAKLSLSKSALYPAYDMLQSGVKHMCVERRWTTYYDLSLSLYSTVAELAIQLGKHQEAINAVKEVEEHAKSYEDKFRVQVVLLKCLTSGMDRNYQAGVDKSIEILKDYDMKIPKNALPGQMMMECSRLKRKFPDGKVEGLLKLPEMTDQRSKNIMKLLVTNLGLYSHLSQGKNWKTTLWWASVRALNLAADKGVTEEVALLIVMIGNSYVRSGDYKEANEYAELGIRMLDRFPESVGSIHAMVLGAVIGGVYSTTKPINESLDLWLNAHHVGLRTGLTEKAGASILGYACTYVSVGLPLGPLKSDLVEFETEARQFNLPATIIAVFKILQQFILNLEDANVEDPLVLKGEAMDEDKLLKSFEGNAHRMTKRDIDAFRLMLANIYGDMTAAEKLIGELEPFLEGDQFVVRASLRNASMALAAFRISRKSKNRKLLKMAKKIVKTFKEELKKGNVNALPIYTMLEAVGSPSKEKFDNAIRACARLGLIHFEAYMCEQAAYYFMEEGSHKDMGWAEHYLAQAFVLYEDWGASAKANQLKQLHPRLLRAASLRERVNSALKGRKRYSSSHTDLLKDFDWERLSSSSGGSSRSNLVKNEEDLSESTSDTSSETGSSQSSGVFAPGIFTTTLS